MSPAITVNISGIPYRKFVMHLSKGESVRIAYVHREVCRSFHVDTSAGPHVRHLDGDSLNNMASNLAWGTAGDNARDRVEHARARGEGASNAKLTAADVRHIRLALARKEPHRKIAEMFGVSAGAISGIATGKSWGWLD